ncbi:2,3-bisphosphoglycerate-dependent phosphoglycerate mutase [Pontibacter mangrovi]|uniref:2,3-bisphosphoglycerate-dependent phosphoglycerate mutase n=1 Tax=Pontibacter mangrovi TaxID=2589816 RepID=A0A501W0A4_9BACT|nr:2,3-bisphosphoglycerate-dependent phosphoglycerate mutase [Pontibacter mangrovi]TPE43393.1 2,3-bisphosphoglycerate-dependent phosphoglycerate mutase [Pontibacter mangrovi]
MALLVLIRHGQSQWNLENRFTGTVDVALTPHGRQEARLAGHHLKGIRFSVAYTSDLRRAQESLQIILKEIGQEHIPVYRNSALNERNYGDLQGLNKLETAEKYGAQQVMLWRRSFDVAPPHGESLKDTQQRVLRYYHSQIEPHLRQGENVLVVAHGNSLRALVMYLDQLSQDAISHYDLPTATPLVYTFDADLKKCIAPATIKTNDSTLVTRPPAVNKKLDPVIHHKREEGRDTKYAKGLGKRNRSKTN